MAFRLSLTPGLGAPVLFHGNSRKTGDDLCSGGVFRVKNISRFNGLRVECLQGGKIVKKNIFILDKGENSAIVL